MKIFIIIIEKISDYSSVLGCVVALLFVALAFACVLGVCAAFMSLPAMLENLWKEWYFYLLVALTVVVNGICKWLSVTFGKNTLIGAGVFGVGLTVALFVESPGLLRQGIFMTLVCIFSMLLASFAIGAAISAAGTGVFTLLERYGKKK